MQILVIGGGPAGFFAAIAAKKTYPHASVTLHERTNKVLSKVRISGGGRCNVTHSCFDPKELVKNYPRGSKELLGPFHRFQPADTVEWFAEKGVELKTEADGRMFPTTDSSQTIIDCLLTEAKRVGVEIKLQSKLSFEKLNADRLILATGSTRGGFEIAQKFGHTIQPLVPSLFTFNIHDFPLESISGVSVENVGLKLEGTKLCQQGPLLITHWGFSGPAALKLSAFGARFLAENNYEVGLYIDWLPKFTIDELMSLLTSEHPAKKLSAIRSIPLPKRLWNLLCEDENQLLSRMSKPALRKLCEKLKADRYQVKGKTTNKEEFVTCGGVTLSEVNFKTMESKLHSGFYFCGEILDIDGVTGGFNFQNAWTTGWLAGTA
ncbi:NAD(P)/FAD-dependent oxidoreductase [Simkania sp.]|uniref:NAD(P)/FAD-dependent oxidoreductase n=1 Tax=Simkania sp. TaxID=34094 RepID=UPI003B51C524